MSEVSRLPPNATRWETAEELADATRYPLDTDVIRRTKDALEVDPEFLPLLAWERSVDIWFPGQTEAARRYITDRSFAIHKTKGTRRGMKWHLELADAEVPLIETPPLMCFPGRDLNAAERAAWLARFKQIRTYRHRDHGAIAGAMYLTNDRWFGFQATLTPLAVYAVTVNGYEYDEHRSTLFDPEDGSELPLKMWRREVLEADHSLSVYDVIALPPNIALRWFMDQPMVRYFCPRQDPLAERSISVYREEATVSERSEFFSTQTISPGLRLLYVFPKHMLMPGVGTNADWYLDHPHAMPFLTWGRADLYVYECLWLYEPGRGVTPMPPECRVFLDHSWFQFPPFTWRVKTEIKLTLPAYAFHQFMRGYWVDCSMEPYYRALDAARSASSLRDRTLVDTMIWDSVQTGNSTYCGQYVCGASMRV